MKVTGASKDPLDRHRQIIKESKSKISKGQFSWTGGVRWVAWELRGCSTGGGEVANKQSNRTEAPPALLWEEEVRWKLGKEEPEGEKEERGIIIVIIIRSIEWWWWRQQWWRAGREWKAAARDHCSWPGLDSCLNITFLRGGRGSSTDFVTRFGQLPQHHVFERGEGVIYRFCHQAGGPLRLLSFNI